MKNDHRSIKRLVVALSAVVLAASVAATKASASQVVGYGPFGMPTIVVDTGAKNYWNHTQWVSSIYIETPGHCDGGTAQAWTAGFYAARQMCGATFFYINRWVPSGNGVCARVWVWVKGPYWWSGYSWMQSTACISIRV
jgi:hypothetical protein